MKRRREDGDDGEGSDDDEPEVPPPGTVDDENGAFPSKVTDSDDEPVYNIHRSKREVRSGAECPYLDTISRQNLDFDFEKCCSVSLSPVNVYACLVCGKYFQVSLFLVHALRITQTSSPLHL
eukprot:jgi/Botrbrau1/23469/Bobra.106_1s0024.1